MQLQSGILRFFSIKPEPTQTGQDNSAGTTSKKEKPPSDSKYATLKGDAFDEAYIADMLAHHEGALNMSENAGVFAVHDEIRTLIGYSEVVFGYLDLL